MDSPTPQPNNSEWLDDLFFDVRLTCGDCTHPKCRGTLRSAKRVIQSHIDTIVAERERAIRLDEANIWNQMCFARDIKRITLAYYLKQRDDRIHQLQPKEGEKL